MRAKIESAVKKYAAFLDFLGRLLLWPFRRWLWAVHHRLDERLLERPGFPGSLWRLFHRPDWQESSKFNARMWVSGFVIFYPVSLQVGHPWEVNLAVAMVLDFGVYLFYKRRLWPKRQVGYARSYLLWGSFTAASFLFNNYEVARFLYEDVQLGKVQGKVVLGVAGVLLNPAVFKVREKCIPDRSSEAAA